MTSETTLLGFGYSITGKTLDHQLESIKLAFKDWQRRNDGKEVLVLLSPKSPLLERSQIECPDIAIGTHKQVKIREVFVREKSDEDVASYCSGSIS